MEKVNKEGFWHGGWITAQATNQNCAFKSSAPMLRTEFDVTGEVVEAKVYFSVLGYGDIYINGKLFSDGFLNPEWTDHAKRVPYQVTDITTEMKQGKNCIGFILGNGRTNSYDVATTNHRNESPCLRMQMCIRYADGTEQEVCSNTEEWRACRIGPTISNDVLHGEIYNANLEIQGWAEVGFQIDKKVWRNVLEFEPPKGRMHPQIVEPIRITEVFRPTSIHILENGAYILDCGQNLSGFVRFTLDIPKGVGVRLRYAERIYENGELDTRSNNEAKAIDIYVSKGGKQTWNPRFVYHGFRYVQIEFIKDLQAKGIFFEGLEGKRIQDIHLCLDDFEVCVLRSDIKAIGNFECSDPFVNALYKMAWWTEATNQHSIFSDCPQRQERLGWLNDLQTRLEGALCYFDVANLARKTLADIVDSQGITGAITDTVPPIFGYQPADPVAAFINIPWCLYLYCGDVDTVRKYYPAMKSWMEYLGRQTKDDIVQYSYYGDWIPPVSEQEGVLVSKYTPGEFISTGFYYYFSRLLKDMSQLLQKDEEYQHYKKLEIQLKKKLNEEFFNEIEASYCTGNQACNSFALWMGLVPDKYRQRVAEHIVDDIKKRDYHLSTGNITTRMMLEVLCENGYVDIVYELLTQKTYPSWGYMHEQGATTMWECWENDGIAMELSNNHPMNNSFVSTLFKFIGGINPVWESPAFKKAVIRPTIPKKLTFVKTSRDTENGRYAVSWKKEAEVVSYEIEIPDNCSATVALSGNTVVAGTEISKERRDGCLWFELAAGKHMITCE